MKYFYVLDYSEGPEPSEEPEPSTIASAITPFTSPIDVNARMYAMADKFGIKGLKSVAAKKFGTALSDLVLPDTKWVLIPKAYNERIDKLIEVVKVVYDSTPETDHELIVTSH